jgi:hypothetical protein
MEALAANDSQTIGLWSYGRRKFTNRRLGFLVVSTTVFESTTEDESQYKDLLIKLESFRHLKKGWDGYHADIPSLAAIQQAKKFLSENKGTVLPFYFTAPGINGEVMIECKDGEKGAEIYFNPDGTTELLLFVGNDLIQEADLENNQRALFNFFS